VTILSGVYLVWILSAGFHIEWFASRAGFGYSVGGAAALVAFLTGALINIPTASRIGALTSEARSATDGVTRAQT